MRRRPNRSMRRSAYPGAVLAACILGLAISAAMALAGDAPRIDRPRLAVVIVIDQLRGDYLTRFGAHFGEGGFRRFMDDGAYFENALYTHASTATGPGHTTIATGAQPSAHGVVGNQWIRAGETNKTYAVVDAETRIIGLPDNITDTPGKSPWATRVASLGDGLQLTDTRSRVFAVSVKDRGAIYLGGKRPNGVFWWDSVSGNVVTSSWYAETLPDYITAFNESRAVDRYANVEWTPALGANAYAGTQAPDRGWLPIYGALGTEFPHKLPDPANDNTYYRQLYCTPFANALILDVADQIVANERLGAQAAPDLLWVSLSANDYCGHVFGPQSPQVMDMMIQTDRLLADFFSQLEDEVGLEHCLITLTGDHGVSPTPRITMQRGLGGGIFDEDAVWAKLNAELREQLGADAPEGALLLGSNLPWLYVSDEFRGLDAARDGELTAWMRNRLLAEPGVELVLAAGDLTDGSVSPASGQRYFARRAFDSERCGGFYVKLAANWYKRSSGNLAGHTVGNRADRHVPIGFFGVGIQPGRFAQEVDPADIAPTIASLLGIPAPSGATGRVLSEAIATHPPAKR